MVGLCAALVAPLPFWRGVPPSTFSNRLHPLQFQNLAGVVAPLLLLLLLPRAVQLPRTPEREDEPLLGVRLPLLLLPLAVQLHLLGDGQPDGPLSVVVPRPTTRLVQPVRHVVRVLGVAVRREPSTLLSRLPPPPVAVLRRRRLPDVVRPPLLVGLPPFQDTLGRGVTRLRFVALPLLHVPERRLL